LSQNVQNLTNQDLENLNLKISTVKKEQVDLLCKAIKFATKLMTKIVESFEDTKGPLCDHLTKIKLFLKVSRLVVDKAKTQIENSKGKEQEFFIM
jgi:hypothetical protein